MNYRREVDGLRAFAVIPVVFFHAGFELFKGGFVGVDVFFVISGYLITSIILKELEKEEFLISNFYERRIRRIIPSLFFVMFASIPIAYLLLLPSDMKDFSQSLIAVSTFVSNILFWRESGYFDTAAELKPLLHTWSLAVEEQYYILFPLFLLIFWRIGKSFIILILGIVFILSLSASYWAANTLPTVGFYLLPTRGWEILIGAFAAFYLSTANRMEFSNIFNEFFGWLGLFLILFSIFFFSSSTPFPSYYALVPTLGTLMIILCATKNTTIGKFLSNKLFVSFGLISYSLYLWHQPIFAFVRIYTFDLISLNVSLSLIVLSTIMAYFSYRYIETPFRKKNTISRKNIFLFLFLGSFFFISIGVIGYLKDGFSGTYSEINKAINDWEYPGNLKKTNISGFYKFNNNKPLDILFFGDSHVQQLQPLSEKINSKGLNSGFLSGGGCPPIPNLLDDLHPHCVKLFDKFYKILELEKNIKTIIVAGCFNCYFIDQSKADLQLGEKKYNYYYLIDNKKLFFRTGKGQKEALLSLHDFIEKLSKRFKIIFIGDNPSSQNFDPKTIIAYELRGDSIFFKKRYPNFSNEKFDLPREQLVLDQKLRLSTENNSNYISLLKTVCPKDICNSRNNKDIPIYKDGDHMRPTYVINVVGPNLMKLLN